MLSFAGGAINAQDWVGIQQVLEEENIHTVLEFGAGMSSKCFYQYGVHVTTFETKKGWIDKVVTECPEIEIVHWDNKNFPAAYMKRYDLAFVDGQTPRDNQTIISKFLAKRIIFHDGYRKTGIYLIDQYMQGWAETKKMLRGCRYFEPLCKFYTCG